MSQKGRFSAISDPREKPGRQQRLDGLSVCVELVGGEDHVTLLWHWPNRCDIALEVSRSDVGVEMWDLVPENFVVGVPVESGPDRRAPSDPPPVVRRLQLTSHVHH